MPRVKIGSEREREIKKRKAASIIKKKPEKIKDTEYLLLMDIMEDKLKKLKYVGENLFSYIMKKFIVDGKIKICEKEITTNCILDYNRKEDRFVINKCKYNLIWDTTGFFGRNLHNLCLVRENYKQLFYASENGYFEVFEFMLKFMEEFNNVFILITEGKRTYKNKQTKIDRTNINALINNIDKVLSWYYANPRVDSATANLNTNIYEFVTKCDGFYDKNYYKPLSEKLSIPPVRDNQIHLKGELLVQVGNQKYKIDVSLAKHLFTSDCCPTIHIQKWLEPNGWVTMHHDSSLNNIFKLEKLKVIQKSEYDYNDYDHMIKYSLNFINYFENSKINGFNDLNYNFIVTDKFLV